MNFSTRTITIRRISYHFTSFLFLVLAINALLGCTSENTANISSYLGFAIPKDSLTSYLQTAIVKENIPGLSVVVLNRGEVVYHQNLGYSNREKRIAVSDSTIFEFASLSKSMFAFFVMTFVERKELDLDKPLHTYLPHPDLLNDARAKKITARMVLSHRSGLPNWRESEKDSVLRIQSEPGIEYRYSGEGYQYLAMVLMHITQTDHQGFERLFEERITKPLGLWHTHFIQTTYTRAHKAEPYNSKGNRIDWSKEYYFLKEDGKFYAPASLHTEPLEFSRWIQAIMQKKILSESSYKELFSPHSKMPYDGLNVSYALGFAHPKLPFTNIFCTRGTIWVSHRGMPLMLIKAGDL
jgi:CubicO group peptidase (beta-lactamase class C family)